MTEWVIPPQDSLIAVVSDLSFKSLSLPWQLSRVTNDTVKIEFSVEEEGRVIPRDSRIPRRFTFVLLLLVQSFIYPVSRRDAFNKIKHYLREGTMRMKTRMKTRQEAKGPKTSASGVSTEGEDGCWVWWLKCLEKEEKSRRGGRDEWRRDFMFNRTENSEMDLSLSSSHKDH